MGGSFPECVESAMRALYVKRANMQGDWWDQNVAAVFKRRKVQHSIVYQVLPMQALMENNVMITVFFILSVLFMISSILNFVDLASLGHTRFTHYRFQNLDPESSIFDSNFSFGLLVNGCPLWHNIFNFESVDNTLIFNSTQSLAANGWYLEIHKSKPLPKYFKLEASGDGRTWDIIGSSSKRFQFLGYRVLEWVFRYDRPLVELSCEASCLKSRLSTCCSVGDLKRVHFDHRWSWPMLLVPAVNFEIALIFMSIVFFGASTNLAKYIASLVIPIAFGVVSATFFTFALLWCVLPDRFGSVHPEESVLVWMLSMTSAIVALVGHQIQEQDFPDLLIIYGFLLETSHLLDIYYANGSHPDPGDVVLASFHGVFFGTIGILTKLLSDHKLVVAGRKYRACVQTMNSQSESDAELVRSFRDSDVPMFPRALPVQRCRPTAADKTGNAQTWTHLDPQHCVDSTFPDFGSEGQPIMSLDQLLAQAEILQPFLNYKVVRWACASNGLLAAGDLGFVGGEALADPLTQARVAHPAPKPAERIADKLLCSLGSDASRLLDVCRHRIVFERGEDLRACLDAIALDPEVRVECVLRRGMELSQHNHDAGAAPSAEMPEVLYHRCVLVYLRLTCYSTWRLGLERHVCELQLMPRVFSDALSDSHHDSYVEFRNAKDGRSRGVIGRPFRWLSAALSRRVGRDSSCVVAKRDQVLGEDDCRHSEVKEGLDSVRVMAEHFGDCSPDQGGDSSARTCGSYQDMVERFDASEVDRTAVDDAAHGSSVNDPDKLTQTWAAPPVQCEARLPTESATQDRVECLAASCAVPSLSEAAARAPSAAAMTVARPEIEAAARSPFASSTFLSFPGPPKLEPWVECACRRFTLLHGAAVGSQLSVVYAAMARASYSSCFFTSTPVASALSKPIFRQLFFNIGLMFMFHVSLAAHGLGTSGLFQHRWYRFTALELRGEGSPRSASPPSWRGVSALGLLRDGCPVYAAHSQMLQQVWDGRTAIMQVSDDISANGWFFATPPVNQSEDDGVDMMVGAASSASCWVDLAEGSGAADASDPVRFLLEGTQDLDGILGWEAIGGSEWVTGERGRVWLLSTYHHDHRSGAHPSVLDMRAPLLWFTSWFAPYLVAGTLYWIAVGLSIMNYNLIVAKLGALGYLSQFFFIFLCGFLALSQPSWLQGAQPWRFSGACFLRGSVWLVRAVVLAFAERWFAYLVAPMGVFTMGMEAVALGLFEADGRGHCPALNAGGDALGLKLGSDATSTTMTSVLFLSSLWMFGVVEVGFGALTMAVRKHFVGRAKQLIDGDRREYDATWACALQLEGAAGKSALDAISSLADRVTWITRSLRPAHRLQDPLALQSNSISSCICCVLVRLARVLCCSALSPPMANANGSQIFPADSALEHRRSEAKLARRMTVTSRRAHRVQMMMLVGYFLPKRRRAAEGCLDQLITQALGLDPLLRDRCKQWALKSRGLVSLKPARRGTRRRSSCRTRSDSFCSVDGLEPFGTDFGLWEDLVEGGEEDDAIWAKVKRPLRAVEKTVRSYSRDPSTLVDLCRQALVFQTLSDLADGLAAIFDDPEVVVVRVKDRLAEAGTGGTGYRDVAVNLRITSPEAAARGLAGHVCEVQLLPECIARVKKEEGHARYVQWRNVMGE